MYGDVGRNFVASPNVGTNFPLGRYMEDNDYKGTLAATANPPPELKVYSTNQYTTTSTKTTSVAASRPSSPLAHGPTHQHASRRHTLYPENIAGIFFGNPTGDDASVSLETDDTAHSDSALTFAISEDIPRVLPSLATIRLLAGRSVGTTEPNRACARPAYTSRRPSCHRVSRSRHSLHTQTRRLQPYRW